MKKVFVYFIAVSLLGIFWFWSPAPVVLAGDCQVSVSFSVSPNPAPVNQSVVYTAIVSFGGSVFESPGTPNAGFCLKNNKPVRKLRVGFESSEVGDVDSGFKDMIAGNSGPYTFTGSVKPSDKNLRAGQSLQVVAAVYTDFSARVARSSMITVNLTQGVFGTFACVAADGKYACSPSVKSDCSDVPNNACAAKTCAVLSDTSKCNQMASVGTHKACINNACTVVQGPGPDTCSTNANCTGGGTTTTTTQNFDIPNPIGINTFEELVNVIGAWIFNLAIPIAVIIIIYAGVLMLTAGGEPKRFTKGTEALKYAVIGLAVVLIGKGFVTLIKSILSLKKP